MLRKSLILSALLVLCAGCCAIEKTAADANLEAVKGIVEDQVMLVEMAGDDLSDGEKDSIEARNEAAVDHAEALVEAVE